MRKPHILSPTKTVNLPNHMIFFDSESHVQPTITEEEIALALAGHTVEKPHDPYLICATFWTARGGKNKDKVVEWEEDYHDKKDFIEDFWKDVDAFVPWRERVYLFAHNAKYDTLVCGMIPHLIDLGYEVERGNDSNPFIFHMVKKKATGKVDKRTGKEIIDRKTLIVLSSTNYYQQTLKSLGKVFNLPKLDFAHGEDFTMDKAIEYCRRDTDILKTAMLAFIQFIKEENLGSFAMTVAGQAFGAFRHRFLHHDVYIHSDERAIAVERRAYAGGRNECFRLGLANDQIYKAALQDYLDAPIYGLDVNSMYPAVMLSERYPVKLVSMRKSVSIDRIKSWIQQGYLITADCYVDTDTPIFHKKDDRLIFPVGQFWTSLCTPEIIEGIKRGIIRIFRNVCVYEGADLFSEFVTYFYNKRLEAKKAGNKVLDLLYKIFLNSLYGKFGQTNENWEKIDTAAPDVIQVSKVFSDRKQKEVQVKVFGGAVFKKNDDEGNMEAFHSFPAVSAHVTAYARMLIFRFAETAGLEHVNYMDTDSLYVDQVGYERLRDLGVIDSKRLGALKLEKRVLLTLYGCKDYEMIDMDTGKKEVKMKGVTKSATRISDDDAGHVRFAVTQWSGYASGLRLGTLDEYKNKVIVKTLQREYKKGIVLPDGRIEPFDLNEGVNTFCQ